MADKGKILITGATGFVGSALCNTLIQNELSVVGVSRGKTTQPWHVLGPSLSVDADWSALLINVSVVIHCAALVHQMRCGDNVSRDDYLRINTEGTLKLARDAVAGGVKRFIYLSSVKVNGEFSQVDKPFSTSNEHIPADPYGFSKYQAETQLLQLAKETGLEVVIIRPPLVYGKGVKANFLSMVKWVKMRLPLPFSRVDALRSLVYIDNLVDLIVVCCTHPNANGRVFMVSDDHDVTLPDLLSEIADAMGKRCFLFPIPIFFLKIVLPIIGLESVAQRLLKPLQVDISETKQYLDWVPPVSFSDAISITVKNI